MSSRVLLCQPECYSVILSASEGTILSSPICRGYSGEEPPLPIPNREVKLTRDDGTATPGGRVIRRGFSRSPSLKRPGLLSLFVVGFQRCSKHLQGFGQILYFEDVPVKAAINEAVELDKLYDEAETVAFVNGVLGGFVRGELGENAETELQA